MYEFQLDSWLPRIEATLPNLSGVMYGYMAKFCPMGCKRKYEQHQTCSEKKTVFPSHFFFLFPAGWNICMLTGAGAAN